MDERDVISKFNFNCSQTLDIIKNIIRKIVLCLILFFKTDRGE
ncbi:hypothetical protein EAL2_c02580 [Peptoclostridium acidaminophilum DSM 3953]|uniref:Uncharacterized protein n=1 Tax=Peptoclostridium acidaminophilum DSM 3953 TaxID=1286171 RepID=W8U3K0_PEPAC|nr:hypothetical protein EAL2_c02580 [Peptoclostridium acidaminophilum DSM 3953]